MEEQERVLNESPFQKKRRVVSALIAVAVILVLATAAALLVRHYVLATFIVDGPSMNPTLNGGGEALDDGDTLVLNRVATPKRGDIVVFYFDGDGNGRNLVKRVIAVGGDTVTIKNNAVYLNGELLQENYIAEPMVTADIEVTVSEGCLFVMGDNRNESYDSRFFGEISCDSVVGKCFLIVGTDNKLRLP